ncbi:MAG: hypothetical protein IT435_08895 [Phycisphaerales bacterium]|nr:hypothetical protein [Phycisphaerales bacterium]
MSTRELVELAQLDAMGLLDEQEALEFEAAFAAAPAEIQEQIRKEQSRLCVLEPVLPEVQTPEHLRGKVLSAVHEAIVESIVRTPEAAKAADLSVMTPVFAPAVRHEGGRALPGLEERARRRGLRFWRITSVALAAAAVVLGITTIRLQSQFSILATEKQVGNSVGNANQLFGKNIDTFLFSEGTHRIAFSPAATMPAAEQWQKVDAAIWHNEDWDEARLLCKNLPSNNGERYELIALDEEGGNLGSIGAAMQPISGGVVSFAIAKDFADKATRLALRVINNSGQATILLETGPLVG